MSPRPQPSNVLVLGVGPLPEDRAQKLHAPGLRTSQMAHVLARDRHHVLIGLIDFGDFKGSDESRTLPRREELGERMTVCRLRYHPRFTGEALQTLHKAYKFTCVVSTTDIMNSVAASMTSRLPLWLDYNGDPFAEKQLQAWVHNNDAALMQQWKLYLDGLLAGDRFSTCSFAQKCALIGHLGFAGRLNEFTCGEELVHVLTPCSRAVAQRVSRTGYLIKSLRIPADSYMVLFSGGYNSWCDIDTLFYGLEYAMRRNPRVYFVSTGGELAGHDVQTFKRFHSLVEESDLVSRFFFAGWVSNDDMRNFYEQADLAVNVDIFSYEGELGFRNRITDWMQFKLPVVTSPLCELARRLTAQEMFYSYEIGNAQSLGESILRAAANPSEATRRATRAMDYLETQLDENTIYAPLVEWARNPVMAGDRQRWMAANSTGPVSGLAAIQRAMIDAHDGTMQRSNPAPRSISGIIKRIIRKVTPS